MILKRHTRFIALLLVLVLAAFSMFSCKGPFVNSDNTPGENNGVTNEEGETPSGENDKPTPEQHTHVFGNWVTVKEASNIENGIQERTCYCGKIEQQTIKASGMEYSISYRNIKSADYPTPNGYNSVDGLLNLPEIITDGYVFIGWYTASIGGDLVDYIPSGTTGDIILFAHWELIEYEITYRDVPSVTNVTTYTIESSIKLTSPKWSGLEFSYWSDESGNKYYPEGNITSLPKKLFGDITLTANWKVLRNIATNTSEERDLISAYSGKDGYLYMVFELGTIEHIVLDNMLPDMYYKYEGMPISLHLSQTVSVSEETAQSVAKTVSHSVSKTTSFSVAQNWARENSFSENGSVDTTVGAKIGNCIAEISASVETSMGYESSNSTSWSSTTGKESQSSSSSGTSESVSNSIAYKKDLSSTFSEDITVSADLPSGYYAYVHAANVRVFGVVTYDISTGNFYLDTYSRLDNMHSMMMYYANVDQLNNPSVEGLDFNIPEEKILSFVNNFYYVNYDANGGEGEMETSLHSIDGNEHLTQNKFTKEGCIFAGWQLITNDGVKILLDGQSVTNLGKAHETITLKAIWEADQKKDVVYTLTTKTGYVSYKDADTPECKYSVVVEYRNRTADSIEIRLRWTSTISDTGYDPYRHKFIFNVGSTKATSVVVVPLNAWKTANTTRSLTGESDWVTISLNSTGTTTINLQVYYWKEDSSGKDLTGSMGYSGVKTTWVIDIPAL